MSLAIPQAIVDGIVEQARAEAPDEACGILGGAAGVVASRHPMENADHCPEHFTFVPAEHFRMVKALRAADETVQAVYHSHPATPARPSEEDIRLAFDPDPVYVIVSLAGDEPDAKGFKIVDGTVTPVEIIIA